MRLYLVWIGFAVTVNCLGILPLFNDLDDEQVREIGTATILSGLEMEALHAHNVVRRNHVDTPPLVWDKSLEVDAQNYALVLANTNTFKHSVTKEGENLYVGTGSLEKEFSTAAYLWYEEINRYDYKSVWKYNFWGAGPLGHFTQMVWAGSRRVGCAGSIIPTDARSYKTYYVCRYSPAGNIAGQYSTEVKPLRNLEKIRLNPQTFIRISSCIDTNPAYCGSLHINMCSTSGFAQYNKKTCPKTCAVC